MTKISAHTGFCDEKSKSISFTEFAPVLILSSPSLLPDQIHSFDSSLVFVIT
jgi:hypothetical protein